MSETISFFLENELATQNLGRSLASVCKKCFAKNKKLLVTLEGQLGTGKTTLVRAILRSLGVKGAIKSPTYTLLEPYELSLSLSEKRLKIAHLDLYRLQEPEELDYIGGRNLANDYDLVLIEWPQNGQGYLAQPQIKIQLNHEDKGRRVNIDASANEMTNYLKDIKNN